MKRILYTLLGIMLGTSAWAQTLQEQINSAADGATITLDADVNLTSQVEIAGKSIILDLNGKTISYSGSALSSGIILVHNGAGLTINATGGGSINSGIAMAAIALTKKGDDASTPATLVVNGGTITGGNFGITGNGTRPNTDITINGGTITATVANDNFGIYQPQDGKLTITGGTITAHSAAIEMRAGTLNISGGTFTATATEYSCNPNGSGTTTVGAALAIAQHTTKKEINVAISGGTFTGVKAVNESNPQANDPAPQVTMAITDGTFNGEISTVDVQNFISGGTFNAPIPEDYCAEGFKPTDDGNGHYGVIAKDYVAQVGENKYESLAEAVTAAQNGEIVTLLDYVTDNITIPAGKNITLDLNGKTLSGGSVASNGKKAAVVNNGTIVILDSSSEQTGTIKREDDDTELTKSNSYYVIDNQGTMTIKSGSVTNNAGVPGAHNGSSLIRNGEVAEGAVLNIEGGTLTQNNFDVIKNGGKNSVLNITGGTINSANSYAILSYDKVNMSAGEVNGNVCFRSYSDEDGDSHGVGNITGGTINGNITVETYPGNTPNILSECNISGDAVINGTLSIGEGNGKTFTANDENGTIAVSGGTFNNPVPEKYCVEGFIPTKNADGTYGVKEGTYVVQIGETKYETLAEAIAAATDGQTITLIANTTENVTIDAGKIIALDLNGNTLSGGSVASNGKKAAIVNNGTLVVLDSSAEQTGTIKREDDDTGLSASNSYYVIDNHGTMTIKSGNVINNAGLTTSHKGSSLIRNGEPNAAVLNIEGGTLTQNNFDVIKNGGKGTLNISGGTINSANSYAVLSYGDMNMTDGTINGKVCLRSYTDSEEDSHGVGNISGGTINGDITVETYTGNTPNTLSECNISGTAVVTGTLSIGEGNGNTFTANDEKGKFAVSGGTFSSAVPEQYCAEGFIPKDNGDGTYGVKEGAYVARIEGVGYETFAEAIAAATDAQTITLLADAVATEELPANVTIDAKGYALTLPTFNVADGTELAYAKVINAVDDTYKVTTATYNRTGAAGTQWGTVCLPFSLETAPAGYTLYTPSAVADNTLTVTEVTYPVAAGTPVIFYKDNTDEVTITSTDASVKINGAPVAGSGSIALVGTYADATITEDLSSIYYINGDKFHQAKVSLKVPAYRAYINYTAPAGSAAPRALSIVVGGGDDATAIGTLTTGDADIEAIYDAAGRQLSAPQKGINIMKLANGKTVKLIIK